MKQLTVEDEVDEIMAQVGVSETGRPRIRNAIIILVKERQITELEHLELAQDMNKSTPTFATTTIAYLPPLDLFQSPISISERKQQLRDEIGLLSR